MTFEIWFRFIASDNPARASSFGLELIQRTEMVQEMPEMGRVVIIGQFESQEGPPSVS